MTTKDLILPSYIYIDDKGRTVLPCQYDSAGYFINGRAEVVIGDERMYIDLQGNVIEEKQTPPTA